MSPTALGNLVIEAAAQREERILHAVAALDARRDAAKPFLGVVRPPSAGSTASPASTASTTSTASSPGRGSAAAVVRPKSVARLAERSGGNQSISMGGFAEHVARAAQSRLSRGSGRAVGPLSARASKVAALGLPGSCGHLLASASAGHS